MSNKKEIWFVGKDVGLGSNREFEIVGVFDTWQKAESACETGNDFVLDLILNEVSQGETIVKDVIYPVFEKEQIVQSVTIKPTFDKVKK
tara:strand:+ start:141 stop:407 length:267 start_codon:yes stop_codon:yes gene_type:complete